VYFAFFYKKSLWNLMFYFLINNTQEIYRVLLLNWFIRCDKLLKHPVKYRIFYVVVHWHLSDSFLFHSVVDFPLIKGCDNRLHFLWSVVNIGTFQWGFIVYQLATTPFYVGHFAASRPRHPQIAKLSSKHQVPH